MTHGTRTQLAALKSASTFDWSDWSERLDAALARYEAAETAIHAAHMSVIADLREALGEAFQ